MRTAPDAKAASVASSMVMCIVSFGSILVTGKDYAHRSKVSEKNTDASKELH